jgi:hypothetical protein
MSPAIVSSLYHFPLKPRRAKNLLGFKLVQNDVPYQAKSLNLKVIIIVIATTTCRFIISAGTQ